MTDPLRICIQRAETREEWNVMQDDYIDRAIAAVARIEELERHVAEERHSREVAADKAWEFSDRIKELERHVELRDFFLVENDLWEKFANGAQGKINE